MSNPIEAIVGFGLDVKGAGFDKARQLLKGQIDDFSKVATHVDRIGTRLDALPSSVMRLSGLVGVGGLLTDFVRLTDQANKLADAVGSITGGSSGYTGIRAGLLQAGGATGQDAMALGGAVATIQGRVGGSYLQRRGVAGVAGALGAFAGAYGIDPGTAASEVASLELFQRMNPGSTRGVLQGLVGQASAAGMGNQVPLFAQTVSGVTSSLVATSPAIAGPGVSQRVGAFYGAVQGVNPAFRDPSVFSSGIQGVSSAVQGAYGNPRLQAVMQMAGIGYWEQRGGLGGPNGPAIARKLIAYANTMYGGNKTMIDQFFRSNFGGLVGADFMEALAQGKGSFDQLQHPTSASAAQGQIDQRLQQFLTTPLARANQVRNKVEGPLFNLMQGPIGDLLGFIAQNPFLGIPATYLGLKAAGAGARGLTGLGARGLRGLGGSLARRFGIGAATDALGEAAAQGAARAAPGLFSFGEDLGAARTAAAAAGSVGGDAGGSLLAGTFASAAGSVLTGGVAAFGGMMLFPDHTGDQPRSADVNAMRMQALRGAIAGAQRRFGPHWMNNPRAVQWALGQVRASGYPGAQAETAARQRALRNLIHAAGSNAPGVDLGFDPHHPGLRGLMGREDHHGGSHPLGHDGTPHITDPDGSGLHGLMGPPSARPRALGASPGHPSSHAPSADASTTKFSSAVDKFVAAIRMMTGLGTGGVAYRGPAGGGMLNAAGLSGYNDLIGSSTILARAIGGGAAAGGSGTSNASLVAFQQGALGTGGGGGTGSGLGAVSSTIGGGWIKGVASYYNPGQGGMNGHWGGGNPKDPVEPNEWGVAHKSLAFGTVVAIRYKGRVATCVVNDRGPFVAGRDFDLQPRPAQYLGMLGVAAIEYKIVGHSGKASSGRGSQGADQAPSHKAGGLGHAALSAWLGGGGGAATAGGGAGGGGTRGGDVVVNVDGRTIERHRALTRGAV